MEEVGVDDSAPAAADSPAPLVAGSEQVEPRGDVSEHLPESVGGVVRWSHWVVGVIGWSHWAGREERRARLVDWEDAGRAELGGVQLAARVAVRKAADSLRSSGARGGGRPTTSRAKKRASAKCKGGSREARDRGSGRDEPRERHAESGGSTKKGKGTEARGKGEPARWLPRGPAGGKS